MPHRHLKGGHYQPLSVSFGPWEKVTQLLEAGVVDAQALNWGRVHTLASKLGMSEIERAREEAERIGEESGHTPQLYGLPLLEVVRVAKAAKKQPGNEILSRRLEEERSKLYGKMAQSAGVVATREELSA